MSSFIDLMGSDVWTEVDIKSRLHAEIRSEVSEFAETELNRALQGKMLGIHTMSAEEMQTLMRFKSATERVAMLGKQARLDTVLLAKVLLHEAAVLRLSLVPVEPLPSPEPVFDRDGNPMLVEEVIDAEYIEDASERREAEAVVAGSLPDVLALNLLRNPVEEDE